MSDYDELAEIKKAIKGIYEGTPFCGLFLVSAFLRGLKPVYGHDRASTLADYLFQCCCYNRRAKGWGAELVFGVIDDVYLDIKNGRYMPTREEIKRTKERLAAL